MYCKYCLDFGNEKNMISPCKCLGSLQYVHKKCLFNHFKFTKFKDIECKLCNYKFNIYDKIINQNCEIIINYLDFLNSKKISSFIGINFLITNIYFLYKINPFLIFFLIYYLPFMINLFFIKYKYLYFNLYKEFYIFFYMEYLFWEYYLNDYLKNNVFFTFFFLYFLSTFFGFKYESYKYVFPKNIILKGLK